MKTISMRIRGAKTELEEAGESTEGMVESTAKLRQEILALSGVDIMQDEDTFKSTYAILDELSKKWEHLTDIQQASIIELMAGKHQGNIMSSLMANFETARDVLKTSSAESEGSAMKEHEKWSDSLEARLLKLKATWQSLSQSFLQSDFLKVGITGLTKFVDILDKVTSKLGTLGTIGLGAGIFGMFKHKNGLSFLLGELSTFSSLATEAWKSGGKLTDRFKNIGAAAGQASSSIGSKLAGSFSAAVGAIGLTVAAVSLLYEQYKKVKEEAAKVRQETISSSNEFLDASSSFEQAYIKYSGKTSLTSEEEAELSSAIQGTVNALGDKSGALQNVVNSSDDYLASLEKIADEEIKAANRAAKAKRNAAKKDLEEAAMGYETFDGSEVDVEVYSGMHDYDSETAKIAKEIGKDFYANLGGTQHTTKVGFELSADASVDEIIDYYNMLLEYQEALSDAELTDTDAYDNTTAAIDKMSEAISVYIDGVYEAAKAQYQLKNGIPKTTEEYLAMRESILDGMKDMSVETRKTVSGSLDTEYGDYFDLTSAYAQSRKLIGILDEYGGEEAQQVETFLNMRTAVNSNECTVGTYISQLKNIKKMRKDWDDEAKEEFDLTFGIDSDAIEQQYDEIRSLLTDKARINALKEPFKGVTYGQHVALEEFFNFDRLEESQKEIDNFLNNLSASELAAVYNLRAEINWDNPPEKIMQQIEKEAAIIEAMSFSINIDVEAEKLENLSTAVTESLSGAGLKDASISVVEDMFGDLDSYDPSKLFESTANGIRLNTDEFRKLNDEYKKTNIDGLDKKMDALGDRYFQTREELSDLTYGTDEYNKKARELRNIEDQIKATETLMSQYRGLASAYQAWQRAESAGSQRDMYEGIIGGLENIDDEISRGWLDDGTTEFLRLIYGDNISAVATTKELSGAYKKLGDTIKYVNKEGKVLEDTGYSVRDFFTVDKDGNSTNTGVYNFLDTVGKLEEEAFGGKDVVKRDGKGNIIGFDFKVAGGDKAIADALGISEELVQIMVRAADDAGFVVSMDGTYQNLDILKEKAEDAAQELKNMFKGTDKEIKHPFFEDGSKDGVLKDYQEASKIWAEFAKNKNADGTVDMSVKGAEEAFTLVSTLQSMVDRLNEPVYMELDSSQVEKDMQTPLSKLQEYERLVQTENQLKLKGTDTSEIDKAQDEILNYFEGLSPEIKADLGIKNLSRQEIQQKIEAGEIQIPATIDLQVEMNNTLRDLVNVGLRNAGLIDDEELNKRVDISLYAGEIDTSDVEDGIDNAVKKEEDEKTLIEKIVEVTGRPMISNGVGNIHDVISKYTEEDQQVVIEFLADTSSYDNLNIEDKEVIVKFLAETIDVDDYSPEEKEAYVRYIADGGSLDGWTPEDKEAVAKYLVDGTVVEGYNPADLEAKVKYLRDTVDIDNWTPEQKQAFAKYLLDSKDPDNYQMPTNKWAFAKYLKDTYDIDTWTPPVKEGEAGYSPYLTTTALPTLTGGTALYTPKLTGGVKVNGTANVNGTAFADGTTGRAFKRGEWGTKDSGVALGGELGQETIVRNGKFFTIGDDGAEFFQYRKGDIIFNHKQTEELFKNGKVTSGGGRGKAFAQGTAFAGGSVGVGGIGKHIVVVKDGTAKKKIEEAVSKSTSKSSIPTKGSKGSNDSDIKPSNKTSSSKSGGGGGGSSSAKDDFEETLDWIETKIDRIERVIDELDTKVSSVYRSWSERNNALVDEISKVQEEIEIQQAGYERYLKEANSVGLSEDWAEKVRNGEIDIETIKDEDLADKIKQYKTW